MNRPKSIMCYICGREYGTTSIKIHIKSCEKKWENEQSQLPAKKRKPCPQAPRNLEDMIMVAQGKKPQSVLETARRDEWDDNPISTSTMTLQDYNDQVFRQWNDTVLEPCPHCNRTFRPEALVHHLKSCKAGKPLKKPLARNPGQERASVATTSTINYERNQIVAKDELLEVEPIKEEEKEEHDAIIQIFKPTEAPELPPEEDGAWKTHREEDNFRDEQKNVIKGETVKLPGDARSRYELEPFNDYVSKRGSPKNQNVASPKASRLSKYSNDSNDQMNQTMEVPTMPSTSGLLNTPSRNKNAASSRNLMSQTMTVDEKRKLISATPSLSKGAKMTGGATPSRRLAAPKKLGDTSKSSLGNTFQTPRTVSKKIDENKPLQTPSRQFGMKKQSQAVPTSARKSLLNDKASQNATSTLKKPLNEKKLSTNQASNRNLKSGGLSSRANLNSAIKPKVDQEKQKSGLASTTEIERPKTANLAAQSKSKIGQGSRIGQGPKKPTEQKKE